MSPASVRAQTPTDRVVLQTIAVARWAVWGWLAVTGALQRDELRRPVIAVMAISLAAAWTVWCTVLVRERPALLMHPVFVATEVVIAWTLLVVDGWVFEPGHAFGGGQNLAGNWPLVASIAGAIALGPVWGTVAGVLASSGRFVGALANGVRDFPSDRILSLTSSAVFYGVGALVFGALGRRLREVEDEVALRRARDQVARRLHDGVLQTLALVDRRTRDHDPELAAVARASDRELRSWLFHGVDDREQGGTLEERLRRAADQVARLHDLAVTVSVLDDPDEPLADDAVLDALTGAAGEALTNVAKHAGATRAVVFAEVEDGMAFVSVRDDGRGFDPDARTDGRGIEVSIVGRMHDIGGRVEISSRPGGGTEVRMWSR